MYLLKNALRNIARSKGRNILIGLIVLVLAVSSCLALSIRQSASKARQSTLESMEITAQISVDRQSLMQQARESGGDQQGMREAMMGFESLSLDEMQTYAGADSVKSFYYSATSSLSAGEEIEPVDTSQTSGEDSSDQTSGNGMPPGMQGGNDEEQGRKGMPGMGSQGDFTLVGYSEHAAMTSFVEGTSSVTDGAVFDAATSDSTCLVSDELATLNGFEIGSEIELVNPNDDTETFTLTVCGIYHNEESSTEQAGGMRGFSAASDPANQIYTSYATLRTILDSSAANAVIETDEETGIESSTALREQTAGTYVFATKGEYEQFESQVREMGLAEEYTVSSSDLQSYENSLVPLENLSKYATYFLAVILAIGAVILIVLNVFSIRERKYEVGVLTAIGMKKGKVAVQFVCELFVVTIVSVLIGTAGGAAVSVPVTNALLETQVSAQQQQAETKNQNFGGGFQGGGEPGGAAMQGMPSDLPGGFGQTAASYISQVSSSTDFTVVSQLLGIGVVLTILSSCCAIVFIMRYEPLKILSNRS